MIQRRTAKIAEKKGMDAKKFNSIDRRLSKLIDDAAQSGIRLERTPEGYRATYQGMVVGLYEA